jgi:uncharacterized phage protein (TIGR02220 family)
MAKGGFIVLPNKIIRSESLDVYEKVLFAVLLSYNGADKIYVSHATLAKQTGMSQRQVGRAQEKLCKKGYISVKNDPSYRSNIYTLTKKGTPDSLSGTPDRLTSTPDRRRGYDSQSEGGTTDSLTNNKSINNKSIINMSGKQKNTPDRIPFVEIIEKLNKISGKNFRHTSKETQRAIKARWNQGFRLKDFEKVLENKRSWLTDEKMIEFYRPVTLFGTKFESYWNEKPQRRPQQKKEEEKQEITCIDCNKKAFIKKEDVKKAGSYTDYTTDEPKEVKIFKDSGFCKECSHKRAKSYLETPEYKAMMEKIGLK